MDPTETPLRQSRKAAGAGQRRQEQIKRHKATEAIHRGDGFAYEGMQLLARQQRPFRVGDRSAHFDTLLGLYVDVVRDPSRAREKDPDVHNRMRQDLQILGTLKVRQLATAQLNRTWVPADESIEAKMVAKKFEERFEQQYRITEALVNMLDSILDGISIQELMWKLNEDDYGYGIERMFPCFKDRFVFQKDGTLCLLTRRNVYFGEQVHPWQFIKHVYNVTGGSWSDPTDEGRLYWGVGLEDNIYPNYFFKTVVLNLFCRWLQRLASGTLIARFPWKNPEAKAVVEEIMEAYQEDEELSFPSGDEWGLEIKEGTRAPSDVFLGFIEYIDRQISKVILGSTLIIDQGDSGSQALGQVHERTTFGRLAEFDRMGLEETINREIKPVLGMINHIPKHLWPTFRFAVDQQSQAKEVIEALNGLQQLGFQVSAEMVSESTGYRIPKPNETILQAPANSLGGFDLFGGSMVSGQGGLTNMDLSTPEGLNRFRQVVYRSQDHRRGASKYRLATGGKDHPHEHSAMLDTKGNGETNRVEGHGHEVRGWSCRADEKYGHSHDVMLNHGDLEKVVAALVA